MKVMVISAVIQASVALLFIFRLLPIIPGELHLFSVNDGLYERLAYTTDQNYQVLYWVSAPTLLLFRSKIVRLLGLTSCVILVVGLIDLGTRSGLLVLFSSSLLVLWVFARYLIRSRKAQAEFSAIALAVGAALILLLSTGVISSFIDDIDGRLRILALRHESSDGQSNITQRLESLLFFGDVILSGFLPTGLRDFVEISGTVPHSSPTTLLLLYGWFGVLLWIGWLAYPAFGAASRLVKSNYDVYEAAIYISFLSMLLAVLTLPSPFTKLIWMFSGIIFARLSARLAPAGGSQ